MRFCNAKALEEEEEAAAALQFAFAVFSRRLSFLTRSSATVTTAITFRGRSNGSDIDFAFQLSRIDIAGYHDSHLFGTADYAD